MKQIIFTLLVLLSSSLTAQEGWRYIGPVEREVQNIAIVGDLIFCTVIDPPVGGVVMTAKLYRSVDAGSTWSIIDTSLFPKGAGVIGITTGEKELVLSIRPRPHDRTILTSSNRGESWDSVMIPTQMENINRIFVKRDSETIFLIGESFFSHDRLFRSTDYGRTWTEPYPFPASSDGSNIAVGVNSTTSDIYVNSYTNIGGSFFFRSTDNGESWVYIGVPGFQISNSITEIVIDHEDSNILYCTAGGRLQESTDYGRTWHIISLDYPNGSFIQDSVRPNRMFMISVHGNSFGISYSTDRGRTWSLDSSSLTIPYQDSYNGYRKSSWFAYDAEKNGLYIATKRGIWATDGMMTNLDVDQMNLHTYRLEVYPQPVREKLEIEMILLPGRSATLRLINPLGQVVLQYSVESNKRITWNLTDHNGYPIPNGVYLMFLFDGVTALFQRVMVAR